MRRERDPLEVLRYGRRRQAEPLPMLRVLEVPSDHGCRRGWLGEDGQGRPRPCLTCRPHLADQGHHDHDRATEHDDPHERTHDDHQP